MLISAWSMAYAQQREISGKITSSDDGSGLPGVSVVVKGSTTGTSTDADGNFKLRVPDEAAVLVLSYLGYVTREVPVAGQSSFNLTLSPDNQQLNEVVVTALGIERSERSLGYSTQEVKGEDLTFTKQQNVLGALAGKVAGVQVTGSSGASMGGTQKIKIRGVNSITGGGEPLIVIDGTPISNSNFAGSDRADYGNLGQDINPEDIESVNVLKGPTASALYGMRGQYGVIMITTKKGAKGAKKVSVQLNSAFSMEKAGNFMPMQNLYGGGSSQTWRTLPNGQKYVDMSIDESWGPRMDGTLVRQVFSFYPQDPEYGQLTPFVAHPDNIEDFYETGTNLNNGISVSGGNENSTFRLSFNDTRITGVEPNTWLDRNNLGLSASLDLNKKLSLSTNINYARNKAQRPSQGSEWGARYLVQWFQRNVDMSRLENYRYPDGSILNWNLSRPNATTGEITNFTGLYWDNPYFDAYENLSNDRRDRFFGDVGLTYQVLPDLKLSGFVRSDMYTQQIETRIAFGGRRVPAYTNGKYQGREMNYEFLAQYSKEFGDFSLEANLGANLFDRRYTDVVGATAGGLSSPGFYNLAASRDRPVVSSNLTRKKIASGYGMVSLGYKDTYFLDASLRRDHSSTLPDPYWFPSVSGSFVFSELLKWKPLSLGKLRASYAQAGSDVATYATSFNYGVGGVYNGINTLFIRDNLVNPELEPAFANSYEAGVDLKFFNGRLGIDFTYYLQRNKSQVLSFDISGASGYGSTDINAGLIENKGIELSLTGTPIQTSKFSWDAIFNLNRNESMVKELTPGSNVYIYDQSTYSGVTAYLNSYVGQPFGSLIGKAYRRDEATGKILLDKANLPTFTEANHNFGSVLPDFTGGFQNTFRFGKFDLSAMIDYQMGGQFFSRSRMLAVKTGMAPETAALNDNGKNVRDPLSEGGGVKVSGIYAPGTVINGQDVSGQEFNGYVDARAYYRTTLGTHVYEEWIYDASYIKLREIRLGYTIDKALLKSLPIQNIGIAFIARNVAQLWQKAPKGLDPSELSTGAQAISWYESGQSNTVRSYGVNLNITF